MSSSSLTTIKDFIITNIVNRPRVQISIVVTLISLFIVRLLWERSLRAVEKSVTDKLMASSKKKSSSTSSSSSSQNSSSSIRRITSPTSTEENNNKETSPKKKKQQQQNEDSSSRVFASGHERLGHVVTVRVKNEEHPDLESAAKQFASSLRGGSTPVLVVLRDTAGVQGELRQPTHAPLWIDKEAALAASNEITSRILRRGKKLGVITGAASASSSSSSSSSLASSSGLYQLSESTLQQLSQSPTFTVHKEQSTKYSLDASRVMFCSGNTTERMHFGTNVNANGETVVDMFAGIGYFTIPLASSSVNAGGNRPSRIIAIEKNPESCSYLACNTLLNDCFDRVVIMNGDNRTTGSLFLGKANRVLMGYIPCCKEFLPRAVSFLVQVPYVPSKTVSFAPGSTPPSSKKNDNEKDNEEEDQEETTTNKNKDSTSTTPTTSMTQRPVGVIHYHYLSESKVKEEAKAAAMLHVLESLGPQLGSLCDIKEVRVVKSYAPKKYHCVADLHF